MTIFICVILFCLLLGKTRGFVGPRKSFASLASLSSSNARVLDFDTPAANQLNAGPVAVDLNKYNLPLDEILEQWTMKLVAKTANTDGGVHLFAKNSRENLVDTMKVSFARRPDSGMGILLQEVAGGREDGLGITLVTGLVDGGPAADCDIMPGDTIAKVSIRRSSQLNDQGLLTDNEEVFTTTTRCLGYDATVDAISSLPSMKDGCQDEFVLTIKRLRKKPRVKVNLLYEDSKQDTTLELFSGDLLRQAMLVKGIKLNDPLAKRFDNKSSGNCGAGGLCTTCAVSVLKGGELLSPIRNQERQMLQDEPRWRLACKTIVGYGMKEGELTIRVHPRQWES